METFNVAIFFADGTNQYEARRVSLEKAKEVALSHATRPAAIIGITNRVIITDDGDLIVWEWKFGDGDLR